MYVDCSHYRRRREKSRIEILTGIFPGEWLRHRVVIGYLVEQLPLARKERLFEFLKLE